MTCALIYGRRRQGKSTLSLSLALLFSACVIVYDPNAQFNGFYTVSTLEELQAWMEQKHVGVIVYRPNPEAIWDDFSAFADYLWGWGNFALLIDEATTLQSASSVHPKLERLLRQAPRDGATRQDGACIDVTLIQNVHRPVDTSNLCRALASDTFVFHSNHLIDLERFEKQFGPGLARELPRLKKYECAHVWTDSDGRERYAIWRDSERWYTPIGSWGTGKHGRRRGTDSGVSRSGALQTEAEAGTGFTV